MNKVGIISPNAKLISQYFTQEIGSIDCFEFNNVAEFADRLAKSPLRIDTLMIQDSGLSTSNNKGRIMESAEILKTVIVNSPLFEVDRIIYINNPINKSHLEVMEWFQESKEIQNKTTLTIHSYEKYTLEMLKQFLLQFDVDYDNKIKYNLVIRKERNKDLGSKYLDRFETDKTVIIEHSMANPNTQAIKKQLTDMAGDSVVINTEDLIQEDKTEDIKIDTKTLPKEHEYKKKFIGIIGDSKSGTSTTAMILASTLSQQGKTLLVDANYENLGLSYLVEKTLIPEEVNTIHFDKDILEDRDGLKSLKEKTFNSLQLHALVNSLPVKNKYNNEMFAYFLINILNSISESYDYIIVDIPLSSINYYTNILSKLDKLVLSTPPYINNIVGMLESISKSTLKSTDIFFRVKDKTLLNDIIILRTLVFARVNKEIKPMTTQAIDRYSLNILNRTMKVTGIYAYSGTHYIDSVLVKQIMENEGDDL